MKRKLLTLLIALMMICSLSSCEVYSYATTQDDIYVEAQADIVQSNVDFNIVIHYGTPYYYNGSILYYLYNNLYYYPFYYDNYWYVRAYRHPFNHLHYRPYFRPHRYDYRFRPGYHKGFGVPNNFRNIKPIHRGDSYRRPHGSRPDVISNRPNNNRPNRPNNQNGTRTNRQTNNSVDKPNNRNFGGRR